MRATWAAILAGAALAAPAAAAPRARAAQGTPEEARAMVEKAERYLRQHGRERLLAEITRAGTEKKGAFLDRDLYLFAYDFHGVVLAHGANPKLIGRNLWDLADADGKYLIRGLTETAAGGSGWYRYKWSNPLTKKIENKNAYVLKLADDLWVGCGVYGAEAAK